MIAVREMEEAGITLIEPGERLTLENSHEFVRAVQALPQRFAPFVVVNMEKTRLVDSSGVGALVAAQKHVKHTGGGFALAALHPDVQRAFLLMNLNQVFDIHENVALARKYVLTQRG